MNSNNEPETTTPSEPMSSGSSEEKQIPLKIESGCVQCLVQLEGSISATRLVRQDLRLNQRSQRGLQHCHAAMEQSGVTAHSPDLLPEAEAFLESGQSSLKPSDNGTSQLSISTLSQTTIHLTQEIILAIGTRVERMGRHGWRGRITQISVEQALVDWGGSSSWIPLYELYPLDSAGYLARRGAQADVFDSARRGRAAIEAVPCPEISVTPNEPEVNQMKLFEDEPPSSVSSPLT